MMRDYVETYEAMLKYSDHDPTPDEVIRKMGDDWAARVDAARDRQKEFHDQLCGLELEALLANEIEQAQEYERDFDPPEDDELPEDMG